MTTKTKNKYRVIALRLVDGKHAHVGMVADMRVKDVADSPRVRGQFGGDRVVGDAAVEHGQVPEEAIGLEEQVEELVEALCFGKENLTSR